MYLDTTRLIAKHTDNIVDEVWNYINGRKFVELAILLLAAQKQLRGPVNGAEARLLGMGLMLLDVAPIKLLAPYIVKQQLWLMREKMAVS